MMFAFPRRPVPHSPVLRRIARAAAFCLAAGPAAPALAETTTISFSQTIGIERNDELSDDATGTQRSAMETMPYTLSSVEWLRKLDSGAQLRFGADLTITGYPETSGSTDFEGGLMADYRKSFGAGNAWQYRLTGEFDTLAEEGDWTFNRIRVGGRLRYRFNAGHTTTGHLRLGYREQNENTFSGYDQAEYFASLTHAWRPWEDKRTLSGTLYGELRRADKTRFSYDEVGLRLSARFPVSDSTDVIGRMSGYHRVYGADDAGAVRRDNTLKASLGLAHRFSDQVRGEVYAGWDNKNSTFPDRAYSGVIAGVSMTITWD